MAISGGERGALRVLALLAIVGVAAFLLLLAALHFLRPDVNLVMEPMSNYAVGPFGFLFTAADISYGLAALALTLGLFGLTQRLANITAVLWILLVGLRLRSVAQGALAQQPSRVR